MKPVVILLAVLASTCARHGLAAEWEELLVTESDSRVVAVGERKVMAYYGTGAGVLLHGERRAPLGSYECAGVIDIAPEGTSLTLDCTVATPEGDEVYLRVAREKSDTFAAGAGLYHYTGGTGAWSGFEGQCLYQVTYMPSGVHGVETARCEGPALPPPLR